MLWLILGRYPLTHPARAPLPLPANTASFTPNLVTCTRDSDITPRPRYRPPGPRYSHFLEAGARSSAPRDSAHSRHSTAESIKWLRTDQVGRALKCTQERFNTLLLPFPVSFVFKSCHASGKVSVEVMVCIVRPSLRLVWLLMLRRGKRKVLVRISCFSDSLGPDRQ